MGSASERSQSRAVVVHTLAHARAALAAAAELRVPVLLLSPPGAASYMGAGYFQAMIAEARDAFPAVEAGAVLDCADMAGLALAALRQGIGAVRLGGRDDVVGRVADIARQLGAELWAGSPPALDLLDAPDPRAACLDWLRE